jgi:hypothetical protein
MGVPGNHKGTIGGKAMSVLGLILLIIVAGVALYFDNKNGEPGKD